MKFLHTADWHLGKQLHDVNLLEDQRFVLDQFLEIVQQHQPDVILIAGDIYDRSVPAVDAVRLLDETLNEIVLSLKVPIGMIAGNHDSPSRLAFGSQLHQDNELFISGDKIDAFSIEDDFGEVTIHLIPYARPEEAIAAGFDVRDKTHDATLEAQIQYCMENANAGRNIAVAHAFVNDCKPSDSERLLSVGGTEMVSADRFSPFNYTALGHLHRPQTVNESVQYSGSILKYSFSEAAHDKCVILGELNGDGEVTTERLPLIPKHNVRCVSGAFKKLLKDAKTDTNFEDYLEFNLTDRAPVLDARNRLREVYPNVLSVRRKALEASTVGQTQVQRSQITPAEMFINFLEFVSDEKITNVEHQLIEKVVEEAIEEAE